MWQVSFLPLLVIQLTDWLTWHFINWIFAGVYLLTISPCRVFFFFDVAFPCSYATVHAFFIALTAAIMKPNGNWQMSRKCTSAHVGFQLESLVYASKAFDTANRAFWAQRKKKRRDVNFLSAVKFCTHHRSGGNVQSCSVAFSLEFSIHICFT